MLKLLRLVPLLLLASLGEAQAQGGAAGRSEALREFVMAKAGETVRIWTFFDCADPKAAPGAFGTAANGAIAARPASELQCGNPEQPVVRIFYTPREGFFGDDDAVVRGPRGQEVQIKIRVEPPTDVAEAPPAPPKIVAAGARARSAALPAKSDAPSRKAAARPRAKVAGARGCGRRRGEAAILRLFRCELASAKARKRRVVVQAPESAR
jgi:hypothetical protein